MTTHNFYSVNPATAAISEVASGLYSAFDSSFLAREASQRRTELQKHRTRMKALIIENFDEEAAEYILASFESKEMITAVIISDVFHRFFDKRLYMNFVCIR